MIRLDIRHRPGPARGGIEAIEVQFEGGVIAAPIEPDFGSYRGIRHPGDLYDPYRGSETREQYGRRLARTAEMIGRDVTRAVIAKLREQGHLV